MSKIDCKILIVDDEEDVLTAGRIFLKQHFSLVRTEPNPEKIPALLQAETYDVILLDLNMPRKDGREALKEIKSNPDLHDIPVVVFTTSKAEEDIYRSYQLGVNSFITKPVTFDNLITVMQALGKYWFEIVELPQSNGSHND